MTIQQAAAEIERTVRAYTAKDASGMPLVPYAAQRPIYLIGPPGVGKTAVLGQIASKMDIALESYAMTHHTRQSALGLPVLKDRMLRGETVTVTEYTMSEIMAAVYAHGEASGILFLDEINCVSETLMPAMLELLQRKRFGRHQLPEGWVIVCAGNPERYNRAAQRFDPVTLDRVRTIRIEPDVQAWLSYAEDRFVHPAILAYLRLRPNDFYLADGDQIVTPRSWSDLSDMMRALEALGEEPDEALFGQYLQSPAVAESFSLYVNLCRRVSERFQLDTLSDASDDEIDSIFRDAPFDESLFAKTLISDHRRRRAEDERRERRLEQRVQHFIVGVGREAPQDDPVKWRSVAEEHLARMQHALGVRVQAGILSPLEESEERKLIRAVRDLLIERT